VHFNERGQETWLNVTFAGKALVLVKSTATPI
jgi:hypothetical protein